MWLDECRRLDRRKIVTLGHDLGHIGTGDLYFLLLVCCILMMRVHSYLCISCLMFCSFHSYNVGLGGSHCLGVHPVHGCTSGFGLGVVCIFLACDGCSWCRLVGFFNCCEWLAASEDTEGGGKSAARFGRGWLLEQVVRVLVDVDIVSDCESWWDLDLCLCLAHLL